MGARLTRRIFQKHHVFAGAKVLQQIVFINRLANDADVMLLAQVQLRPKPIDIQLHAPVGPPITQAGEMLEKGLLFFSRFGVRAGLLLMDSLCGGITRLRLTERRSIDSRVGLLLWLCSRSHRFSFEGCARTIRTLLRKSK